MASVDDVQPVEITWERPWSPKTMDNSDERPPCVEDVSYTCCPCAVARKPVPNAFRKSKPHPRFRHNANLHFSSGVIIGHETQSLRPGGEPQGRNGTRTCGDHDIDVASQSKSGISADFDLRIRHRNFDPPDAVFPIWRLPKLAPPMPIGLRIQNL